MKRGLWARRSLLSGMGAVAGAFAFSNRPAEAQGPAASSFEPAHHAQDEWLAKIPGKHRVVLDVTSPRGVPDAIRFVGNLFTGNKNAYGLEESDLAMIVVFRHSATAFGYGDAIWGKYTKALVDATDYSNPRSTEPLKGNPFNAAPRNQIDGLAKRGVQFAVCETASRGISRMLAGQGGDAEATFKEMAGNMIPSSRLVPAGVIGVTRAQEYGYRLIYAG